MRAALFLAVVSLTSTAVADETDRHVAAMRPRLDDIAIPLPDREELAVRLAETLDRAARAEADPDRRRARWATAQEVLDQFHERNPTQPRRREFALKAAVYLWARARAYADQAAENPADPAIRAKAVEALDDVVARLKPIETALGPPDEVLTQNVRFRMAQALSDRADLETADSAEARRLRRAALSALDHPFQDASLVGYAAWLRARLYQTMKEYDKAQKALDEASKAKRPPPAADLLEVATEIRLGRKQFDEALKAINASGADAPTRNTMATRVLLARRADAPPGSSRAKAERDLFERLAALRKAGGAEARRALTAVAKEIDAPQESSDVDAWDALAEGHLLLGDAEKAAGLAERGADESAARGRYERAAALRHRAAALYFQAKRYKDADRLLTRVVDDPKAGAARARAGLLRILARGRIAEASPGRPEATAAYLQALESHVRDFPDDPTAAEARWLLGRSKFAAGDRKGAFEVWGKIKHGAPRWLDARLAAADALQAEIDELILNGDLLAIARKVREAQFALDRSLAEVEGGSERVALELRRVVLMLTPEASNPKAALELCDRLIASASTPEERDRARRLRVAAMALAGRFTEAEIAARDEVSRARPEEVLGLVRRLDRHAAMTDSDLMRRRLGHLALRLLTPDLSEAEGLPPSLRNEARLRRVRALVFNGDPIAAKRAIPDWTFNPKTVDLGWLSDLADTYARVEADGLAVDAYRLLLKRRRAGSTPWLTARLGLAESLARSGQPDEALRLVEGTALLHPDLGGGELRNKFDRLRRRLAAQ